MSACLKIFEETRRPELQNKPRLEKKFCHGAENESFNFQCKKNKMHVFLFSGHVLAVAIVIQSSLVCYFRNRGKRNTLSFI